MTLDPVAAPARNRKPHSRPKRLAGSVFRDFHTPPGARDSPRKENGWFGVDIHVSSRSSGQACFRSLSCILISTQRLRHRVFDGVHLHRSPTDMMMAIASGKLMFWFRILFFEEASCFEKLERQFLRGFGIMSIRCCIEVLHSRFFTKNGYI